MGRLTPDELAVMKRSHWEDEETEQCSYCGFDWPCEAVLLLSHLGVEHEPSAPRFLPEVQIMRFGTGFNFTVTMVPRDSTDREEVMNFDQSELLGIANAIRRYVMTLPQDWQQEFPQREGHPVNVTFTNVGRGEPLGMNADPAIDTQPRIG